MFGELLGLVCASWTYLSCRKDGGKYCDVGSVLQPHGTQILGICRLLGLDQVRHEDEKINRKYVDKYLLYAHKFTRQTHTG